MSRTTVFKVAKYLLGGIQSLMVIGTICILFGAISNSEEFKKDLEHDSNSVAFDGMHHHDDPKTIRTVMIVATSINMIIALLGLFGTIRESLPFATFFAIMMAVMFVLQFMSPELPHIATIVIQLSVTGLALFYVTLIRKEQLRSVTRGEYQIRRVHYSPTSDEEDLVGKSRLDERPPPYEALNAV